ncbi:hypothetical protein M378DRAFT_859479 [Amanita muscaria Koide BX008]|uniref:Uncharacterized protein n=1 Tax=Amanita muscaria (strain Koide BX008) TaxID=946122 RepID=A0A0C2T412_AMAMK|nr:hypothetical protein M378DRAFT_859479 [Amanita muscaria Koide BX008]
MCRVIKNFNNLARTKRPIAERRLNNFEGRQQLIPPSSASASDTLNTSLFPGGGFQPTSTVTTPSLTTTTPDTSTNTPPTTTTTTTPDTSTNTPFTTPPLTDSESQPIIATTVSSVLVSTTQFDPTLATYSTSTTDHSTLAATSATLSSPPVTNSLTPTPAPSQIHDYRIPLIVVVCISGVFILTTAIVPIIRHLRKIWQVQKGEARPTIHIPQPRPMIGGTPHEQQPSSSEKVDRSSPRPVGQHARRDQQPISILPPQKRQQSSSQVGHLQRQLVHAAGAQDLPDHERPPAYVP